MKMRRWGLGWAAAALYLLALFGVVWIKIRVVQAGYALRELEDKRRSLEFSLGERAVALYRHKTPAALSRAAASRGYRLPGEYPLDQIRYLDER
jgi:hypothetical protein